MDPWNSPYLYASPGELHANGYDIVTLGADGQPGGEGEDADITN
jgi:general secretion pathway protein G